MEAIYQRIICLKFYKKNMNTKKKPPFLILSNRAVDLGMVQSRKSKVGSDWARLWLEAEERAVPTIRVAAHLTACVTL